VRMVTTPHAGIISQSIPYSTSAAAAIAHLNSYTVLSFL
jgi:hypothetical protein